MFKYFKAHLCAIECDAVDAGVLGAEVGRLAVTAAAVVVVVQVF